MRVIYAPDHVFGDSDAVKLFLAGGITGCPDWQADVIKCLKKYSDLEKLVVFNPRRENFPINDPSAADEQIKWEFDRLRVMDIFSMFFCAGSSDQPICMYELGRNLLSMHIRFPGNWTDRCIISSDKKYRRCKDVTIQTGLVTNTHIVYTSDDYADLIDTHVHRIIRAYKSLLKEQ